ncbi:unnamed protein product, partial [Iphiclides podalirius]
MSFLFTVCVSCAMFGLSPAKSILNRYSEDRISLIEGELEMQLGSGLTLSDEEVEASEILMHWKRTEVDESFRDPQTFNFSKHYFAYRDDISRSKVYQIIRRMPKGAVLHVHSSLMLSAGALLELTYEDHLYVCYVHDELKFQFSSDTPQRPCPVEWQLLSELRISADNVTEFDFILKSHFTLDSHFGCDQSNDINSIWTRFEKVTSTIADLIAYRPVREKFFYRALNEFYNDNIQYIEIRSGLHSLYELNGTVHDRLFMPRLYSRVTERFKQAYPDFVGVKLIVTRHRLKSDEQLWRAVDMARQIKREMPEFYAGFDLVGQEDLGRPLADMLPLLTHAREDLRYYFHAGESNWYGTATDENLFDAVLLGSKRIGHAYALTKHPSLMVAVKQKDIALEVNVVSNVVLSLVHDVRNHPLATYLAFGLPVVLSSDDPGVWGADPLSHDFYITFVGIASRRADLRLLKQLAMNSINYSTLEGDSKTTLLNLFHCKWDVFIKQLIATSTSL